TVYLTGSRRTVAWRPGAVPVVTHRAGVAVDAAHDVLFTYGSGAGTIGPTSLSAPGDQTWSLSSSEFFPRVVSADATYVAGLSAQLNHVQVRSMADGSLVSDWKRHLDYARPLVWEDTGHLVSVLRTRKGWALLRCGVGGDCARVTGLSGDPLSLPFQEVSFR
ncbi:MAG: hypothetical protein QOD98_2631, partial [Nocardioidaceae bacterium]|nr:hypothetical protein [Nocardioidaceae bacterium]